MRVRQVGCDHDICDAIGSMCVQVCVCVYVFVCVFSCVCVIVFVIRMSRGCFSMSILEMENKKRPHCHVELCQCELRMEGGQLGCVQSSCDVDGIMCARVCNFARVYVSVCLRLWLLNEER